MGIFRDINNRKKTQEKEKHPRRWKRQLIAAKKAAKGPVPVNIEDPELYSTKMLKNKLQNPRNNIQISGKNRKRALKRLKYSMRDDQKNEEKKKRDFVTDLFMEDAEETKESAETTEMADADAAPSGTDSSQPSSSAAATTTATTKKKKRGGRKKNKGKGDAAGDDVEMKEVFEEPSWD